jgi:uncharacterized membrane protein
MLRVDWRHLHAHRPTKIILTVIALLLAVIALTPLVQPQPAMAQGSFSGVQFTGGLYGFFDTRTGDIWEYRVTDRSPGRHLKLVQLGKPLVEVPIAGR